MYDLGTDLLPHQTKAIERGLNQNLLIAFDCGLGKTVTAGAIAGQILEYLDNDAEEKDLDDPPYRPVIIVTKKKAKEQWRQELLNWGIAHPDDIEMGVVQRDLKHEPPPLWTITHYEELVDAPKWIFRTFHACVIIDESQAIKTHLSNKKIPGTNRRQPIRRTEAVKRLKGMRKILLSATPSEKDVDYWSQLNYLDPIKFQSFWKFTDKYFTREYSRYSQYGTLIPFASDPQFFADKVLKPWVMFAEKDWVRPKKGYISVELTTPQRAAYKAVHEADDIIVSVPLPNEEPTEEFIANTLARIALERKIGSCPWTINEALGWGAKMEWLEEWAEGLGQSSVVVLAENRATAERVSKIFNIPCIMGRTGPKPLEALKAAATPDASGIIGCGTIAGMGEAIDLPHVDILVFVDYNWSATKMKQAEDRHDRLSSLSRSTKQVLYLTASPVDHLLKKCVENKWTRTQLARAYWHTNEQ